MHVKFVGLNVLTPQVALSASSGVVLVICQNYEGVFKGLSFWINSEPSPRAHYAALVRRYINHLLKQNSKFLPVKILRIHSGSSKKKKKMIIK